MIYLVERCVYFVMAVLCLLVPEFYSINNRLRNIIISTILLLIFIHHFIVCRLPTPFNTIHCNRMFKRYFNPVKGKNKKIRRKKNINWKGDSVVLTIYFLYILTVAICSHLNWLISWNILLFGILFLLGLNNIFKYKICLIKLLAYKNTNCCADCHINGWDDILIFSILPFLVVVCKPLCLFNYILIGIITLSSVVNLILWEGGQYLYPERFSPETNQSLSCENCKKEKCVGKKGHRFDNLNFDASSGAMQTILSAYRDHYVATILALNVLLFIFILLLIGKGIFFDYYLTFIIMCTIPSWCIVYKWMDKKYKKLFYNHIAPIVYWGKEHGNTLDEIFNSFRSGMFQINSLRNVLIYIGTVSFWLILLYDIIVEDRLAIRSCLNNFQLLILVLIFAFNIMIACRAFVIFYNAYRQLTYIARLQIKSDYLEDGYVHIREIRRFCNTAVLIISLVSMLVVIAVIYGPIYYTSHFRIFTISALCLVALCPIIIYLVVRSDLNILSYNMKVKTFKVWKRGLTTFRPTKCKNEYMSDEIDFIEKLFQMKEGPSLIKDYTAIFTFLAGIVQLVLILIENEDKMVG